MVGDRTGEKWMRRLEEERNKREGERGEGWGEKGGGTENKKK